jgi:hypothetical protein
MEQKRPHLNPGAHLGLAACQDACSCRLHACVLSACVIVAAVGCGRARADSLPSAHALRRTAPAHGMIRIDPQIGETFAPVSGAAPLTARQAWARFARLNGSQSTAIPAGVHVQLGLLILPAGPADAPGASHLVQINGEAYTAHNELAYGYSSMSGCPTANPWLVAPPHAQCLSWTFLDASSGKQIDSTWQKLGAGIGCPRRRDDPARRWPGLRAT